VLAGLTSEYFSHYIAVDSDIQTASKITGEDLTAGLRVAGTSAADTYNKLDTLSRLRLTAVC